MRRGSALLNTTAAAATLRGTRRLGVLGGAGTVTSVVCEHDLLSQVLASFAVTKHRWWSCRPPRSNSQKNLRFLSPALPNLFSGRVHRSLIQCCSVRTITSYKGAPVWLCFIKSFFNDFQHFTMSQLDQNHFKSFTIEDPPQCQMLLC